MKSKKWAVINKETGLPFQSPRAFCRTREEARKKQKRGNWKYLATTVRKVEA